MRESGGKKGSKMKSKTDYTLKGEKGMCLYSSSMFSGVFVYVWVWVITPLIFPYSVTCMWAALIGCAVCSGGGGNIWRCKHYLAALHHALPHSVFYFHEPWSAALIAVKCTLLSIPGLCQTRFWYFCLAMGWHQREYIIKHNNHTSRYRQLCCRTYGRHVFHV